MMRYVRGIFRQEDISQIPVRSHRTLHRILFISERYMSFALFRRGVRSDTFVPGRSPML